MNFENSFSFHKSLCKVFKLHFSLSHKTLEKLGLYPGQPPLIHILSKYDGLSQKDLSKYLNIKPATLTVMVKRLEKSGFLKKVIDEKDQRISRIHLTEKGENASKELNKTIQEIDDICLTNFTNEEKNSLKFLLDKVNNNLKNHKENFDQGVKK